MSEPKFKYGDKVRITTGFYRGVIGRVIDCNKSGGWFKKKEWKYTIEAVAPDFPVRGHMLRRESGLEMVEVNHE